MEGPSFRDSRDGNLFTHFGSGSQPSRTSRSWTSNGVHYTVDTASFSSPGLSFGTMTGSTSGPFRSFTTPVRPTPRSSGGGLLGSAFGMIEDVLSVQQQRHNAAASNMRQTSSNNRRVAIDEPSDTDDDDDLIYGQHDTDRSRGRSVFSRIKDRLLDGKQRPRASHGHSYSRSREQSLSRDASPVRRPRVDRRHSSYHGEPQHSERASRHRRQAPDLIEVDYDDSADDTEQFRSSGQTGSNIVEALEEAVDIERRAVRASKKRLENATRQPNTSSHHLQRLLDELRRHEISLMNAQGSLDEAVSRRRSTRSVRPSYNRRNTQPPPPVQPRQPTNTLEDEFFSPFSGFGGPFAAQSDSRHPDPIFQAFQDFGTFGGAFGRAGFGLHDHLFEQMRQNATNEPQFRFYTTMGGTERPSSNTQRTKRTRYTTPNSGPQFQQGRQGFNNFAAPPPPVPKQPPANLLTSTEAKPLFRAYNERWNTMSNTDINIPYPARSFQADALMARDSIWAPLCKADVTTWSEETVMQANAQAFFLGVVGLTPVYKEAPGTGTIEMGLDKSKASPAQIQELTALLKKEKTRWHSDRLGRRNGGGGGGPNEALQKDERARAVFHAVCGLMESAQ